MLYLSAFFSPSWLLSLSLTDFEVSTAYVQKVGMERALPVLVIGVIGFFGIILWSMCRCCCKCCRRKQACSPFAKTLLYAAVFACIASAVVMTITGLATDQQQSDEAQRLSNLVGNLLEVVDDACEW